jgi:uncharacterized protein (TIGR00255 family)
MILSMTGYGKASCDLKDKKATFEIKTLNSKQLDLYLRVPNGYREKEMDFRNAIVNRIKRGKVEVTLTVECNEGRQATQINADIIKNYYRQLKAIAGELNLPDNEPMLQAVLRMPEALNMDKHTSDPEEFQKLTETLKIAADELDKFRINEGAVLAADILHRIGLIESFLEQIEPYEKERLDIMRGKLHNMLTELVPKESLDMNRFEQELIYYIEKLDISEEKTRLRHHCKYFTQVTEEPDQVGRKLGFVAQEIGREINTIGSKANHSGIQKLVVLMKDELEKIKEQLLNVL